MLFWSALTPIAVLSLPLPSILTFGSVILGDVPPLEAKGAEAVTPVTVPVGQADLQSPLRQKEDPAKVLAVLLNVRALL